MNFNFHGKETLVEYSYPWLPSRCSNCAKWGHLEKACLAPKKVQQVGEVEEGEIVASAIRETDTVATTAETPKENIGEVTSQNAETLGVVETEDVMKSVGEEEEMAVREETISTEGDKWMDVSPSKASRSPKKNPDTEENAIVSNSRFSVLSLAEEGEEELERMENTETDTEQAKNEEIITGQKKKIEKEVILRQSLPRGSKDNHRYLTDIKVQKAKEMATPALNKTSSRKSH